VGKIHGPDDSDNQRGTVLPHVKPDGKLGAAWANGIDEINKGRGKAPIKAPAPVDLVSEIMRVRRLPICPWPSEWPELAQRCRLHAGDTLGLVGGTESGKTQWAIQFARAFQARGEGAVLWLPLEIGTPELACRQVANFTRTHMVKVRDEWGERQIEQALAYMTDRWRYVPRRPGMADQMETLESMIKLSFRIYSRPPLVVIDYVQLLVDHAKGKGDRVDVAAAIETVREMTLRLECFTVLISQTSRANAPMLAGKVDIEAASDAVGTGAETAQLERACAVMIVLNVFKADDETSHSDAHQLVSKTRHVPGGRGRVGAEYQFAGGYWHELDHLPATPADVQREAKRQQKESGSSSSGASNVIDFGRARQDANEARKGQADQARRDAALRAIQNAGASGISGTILRQMIKGHHAKLRAVLEQLEADGYVYKSGANYHAGQAPQVHLREAASPDNEAPPPSSDDEVPFA
jgi:KaiC/GvpD/RAD55 family RecA-like ATPase